MVSVGPILRSKNLAKVEGVGNRLNLMKYRQDAG